MNLAAALADFGALQGRLLSGEPFEEEDFDAYGTLGAFLADEAALGDYGLGKKKKKKGIFGKIFGLFKKSLYVMDPLIGGLVNKKKGKKKKKRFLFFGIDGADELGDLSAMEDIHEDLASMATNDPNTATMMASLVTSARALTAAGVALPPKMAASAAAAEAALANVPGGEQKIAEAAAVLERAGVEVPSGRTNWLLWAGVAAAGLAAIGGVAYLATRD